MIDEFMMTKWEIIDEFLKDHDFVFSFPMLLSLINKNKNYSWGIYSFYPLNKKIYIWINTLNTNDTNYIIERNINWEFNKKPLRWLWVIYNKLLYVLYKKYWFSFDIFIDINHNDFIFMSEIITWLVILFWYLNVNNRETLWTNDVSFFLNNEKLIKSLIIEMENLWILNKYSNFYERNLIYAILNEYITSPCIILDKNNKKTLDLWEILKIKWATKINYSLFFTWESNEYYKIVNSTLDKTHNEVKKNIEDSIWINVLYNQNEDWYFSKLMFKILNKQFIDFYYIYRNCNCIEKEQEIFWQINTTLLWLITKLFNDNNIKLKVINLILKYKKNIIFLPQLNSNNWIFFFLIYSNHFNIKKHWDIKSNLIKIFHKWRIIVDQKEEKSFLLENIKIEKYIWEISKKHRYVIKIRNGKNIYWRYDSLLKTKRVPILLDKIKWKIYIKWKKLTSKDVPSQIMGIYVIENLLKKNTFSSDEMDISSYSKNIYDMYWKIVIPLINVINKKIRKKLNIHVNKDIWNYSLSVVKEDIESIWFWILDIVKEWDEENKT